MFQCLYSQCQTADFGSALHLAITQCSSHDFMGSSFVPHILRQRGYEARSHDQNTKHVGSVSWSAIHHTIGYRSISPTRSVEYRPQATLTRPPTST